MDAIELLLNRVSTPQLSEPGPTPEQLQVIFQAALRAPDHAALRPWRFITIKGDARAELGKVFQRASKGDDPEIDEAKYNKHGKMAMRAPLLVVVVSCALPP